MMFFTTATLFSGGAIGANGFAGSAANTGFGCIGLTPMFSCCFNWFFKILQKKYNIIDKLTNRVVSKSNYFHYHSIH